MHKNQSYNNLFARLQAIAEKQSRQIFLVGGYVRDFLLQAPSTDIDLVLEGDATEFAESVQLELGGKLQKFPDFYTAKITELNGFEGIHELDFASTREEIYLSSGALPRVSLAKLEHDQKRRDFTINSIAVSLADYLRAVKASDPRSALETSLLDPFNGLKDLKSHTIRVLHMQSFVDDPTRIFRACRYSARYNAKMEPETRNLAESAIKMDVLKNISWFRILRELQRICSETTAETALMLLFDLQVWQRLQLVSPSSCDQAGSVLKALCRLCAGQPEKLFPLLNYFFIYFGEDTEALLQQFPVKKKLIKQIKNEINSIKSGEDESELSDSARLFSHGLKSV